MKPLNEVYEIIALQQSIRVGRLKTFIQRIHREISLKNALIDIQKKKIDSQQETIDRLNKRSNRQKTKLDRLKRKLESYEEVCEKDEQHTRDAMLKLIGKETEE